MVSTATIASDTAGGSCLNRILPPELLCSIFKYLSLADRHRIAATCRLWRDLLFSASLPDPIVFREWPDLTSATWNTICSNVGKCAHGLYLDGVNSTDPIMVDFEHFTKLHTVSARNGYFAEDDTVLDDLIQSNSANLKVLDVRGCNIFDVTKMTVLAHSGCSLKYLNVSATPSIVNGKISAQRSALKSGRRASNEMLLGDAFESVITNSPDLEELLISGINVPRILRKIMHSLKNSRSLASIDISHSSALTDSFILRFALDEGVDATHVESIMEGSITSYKFSQLRSLNIANCQRIGSTTLNLLPHVFPYLESLNVAQSRASNNAALAYCVTNLRRLKVLDCSHTDWLQDEFLEALEAAPAGPQLAVLRLSECAQLTCRCIGSFIRSVPSLSEIDLDNTQIDSEILEVFASMPKTDQGSPRLKVYMFDCPNITHMSVHKVLSMNLMKARMQSPHKQTYPVYNHGGLQRVIDQFYVAMDEGNIERAKSLSALFERIGMIHFRRYEWKKQCRQLELGKNYELTEKSLRVLGLSNPTNEDLTIFSDLWTAYVNEYSKSFTYIDSNSICRLM
ncbi:hypothetical protein CANCADRAFT_30698 [Tortispora caseinolytica NRRL Y-17796]|uniref:F-box domain-containing protein n=1 Tax=Tortispora caseinolytica NRRL Y-17796 TaxID=767744 RepID=A0A1E4TLD2_9ASCO|nr:hypothetical protein CANCADRAFT_30698 [Tortispora caseinolytica NRRL Y-17796]